MLLFVDNWDDGGHEASIIAEATDLGLPRIRGLPNSTTVVGEVLEEYTERPNAGRGVYKYLSALSHGTTYATLERFRGPSEPTENPFTQRVSPVVTIQSVEFIVRATVGAHVSAVARAVKYCGLDPWAWDRWRRKLGEDFRKGPPMTGR